MRIRRSLFWFAAAALVLAGGGAFAAPKMHVTPNEFNFGKVPQQSTYTTLFWIKSTGSDTLRILEIDPGCSCTQMPLPDSSIAPGDSVPLGIIFKSGRMRGNIGKAPKIKTNASAEFHYLKLYAYALTDTIGVMPLGISPAIVDVSQFSEKRRRKATVRVTNRSPNAVTISLHNILSNSFSVTGPTAIAAGATIELTVQVKEEKVATSFQESFTISVSDEDRSVLSVPVVRTYAVRPGAGTSAASSK